MKIIECLSETIEQTLDMAENAIKAAIMYKMDYPTTAKTFYTQSTSLMDNIKELHDAVVALIESYKKEKGEPPVPMMAIYNYEHKRHITQAAAIKNLQDMFMKN